MLAKVKNPQKKEKAEAKFSFELKQMKKAVEAPSERMPKFQNFEDFDKWIDSL
jgi:hypothetical protein